MTLSPATCRLNVSNDHLLLDLRVDALGLTPRRIWNPSPSTDHRREPYPLPMTVTIDVTSTQETAAKFSPPPYAVALEDEAGRRVLVHVVAESGWHRWNRVVFAATAEGLSVSVAMEDSDAVEDASEHVALALHPGRSDESRHELLARALASDYPSDAQVSRSGDMPRWWQAPIYCGWGDQVAFSLWAEGPGPERRALAYCLQGLYERWIDRLDEVGVPLGTIIIDAGWSPTGVWVPEATRWPDLKGFIARQHDRGRRVLLWVGTWLWDGLPDEHCIFADDVKLVADPTHPNYCQALKQWINDLLSPRGLDADGFKIDQLAYVPSRHRPRGGPRFGWTDDNPATRRLGQHGPGAGIELLHRYQQMIFRAAKAAKPDALITSSTVHPYFADTFDMVRLHDTGPVTGDPVAAMQIRADLARSALPGKPIDADDWIFDDYDAWLSYTLGSHRLGVPCLFYSERFVQSMDTTPVTRRIPRSDLRLIGQSWRARAEGGVFQDK
jgi:hypothetical protein